MAGIGGQALIGIGHLCQVHVEDIDVKYSYQALVCFPPPTAAGPACGLVQLDVQHGATEGGPSARQAAAAVVLQGVQGPAARSK
jgi:hypothetical protein